MDTSSLSMQELRKLAKEYKLAAGGTKAELKDRIDLYIEEQKPKKGQTKGRKKGDAQITPKPINRSASVSENPLVESPEPEEQRAEDPSSRGLGRGSKRKELDQDHVSWNDLELEQDYLALQMARVDGALHEFDKRRVIEEAKIKWPDRPPLFSDGKLQHEYAFLAQMGRACHVLANAPRSMDTSEIVMDMEKHLRDRLTVIAMGAKGRWDAAGNSLDYPVDTVLAEVQPRVEAAIERADKMKKTKSPQVIVVPQLQARPVFKQNGGTQRSGCYACGGDHAVRNCPNNQPEPHQHHSSGFSINNQPKGLTQGFRSFQPFRAPLAFPSGRPQAQFQPNQRPANQVVSGSAGQQ